MYLYQITNTINGKIYIGQTNNIQKRWSNHKCCNSPDMVIAKAIKKYGVENFKFEILYKNVSIEEIDELEIRTIKEKNSRVPNGYNVSEGGSGNRGVSKYGEDNSNAHLTNEEAQYILDHRDIPMYVLYDKFCDKISYSQFKKIYHHGAFTNFVAHSEMYPYNFEFSNQFTSGNFLEYDEVVDIRTRYNNGEYWESVYQDYNNVYEDKWKFWNVYYGNYYKLVMPEVFTPENRKKHSKMGKQGERNGRAKLSANDVREIRELSANKIPNSEIYKKYPNVTTTTILDIINKKTWKSLL